MDMGVFRSKLIGECTIDFKSIKGIDNRILCSVASWIVFVVPLVNPKKQNHHCGTLRINLHLSRRGSLDGTYASRCAIQSDPNCYCPVLRGLHRQNASSHCPPLVHNLRGLPSSGTSPFTVNSRGLFVCVLPVGGLNRAAPLNPPRPLQSKSSFYQQDSPYVYRPPVYDKRMYPMIPNNN